MATRMIDANTALIATRLSSGDGQVDHERSPLVNSIETLQIQVKPYFVKF